MKNPGRNEPCPCGSGKKYKQCCGQCDNSISQSERLIPTMLNVSQLIHSGLGHHQSGRFDQAKSLYQQALDAEPEHPKALHLLGTLSHQTGENEFAIELLNRAIRADPSNPTSYFNLGAIYSALNQPDKAIIFYQKALKVKPDYAEALNNLGNTFKLQGELNNAIACYKRITSIQPGFADAHNNLGNALKEQGKLDEAIECYQHALSIKHDHIDALNNLGTTLISQEKLDEAIICYKKALTLKPDYAEAHFNLGNALFGQSKLDEAVISYSKALTINPYYIEAYNNLGNAYKDQGNIDKALANFQYALDIKPAYADAYSNKLLVTQYTNAFTPHEILHQHLKFAEIFEAPLKHSWPLHSCREPEKRLKIGYISPDFRNHAVAYFIEPVLANHDKDSFEIFCYYNNTAYDQVTDAIKATTSHWIQCAELSDAQLAERIRSDKIDILVDLAGHSAKNRLLVFARKPAPVQITYLGYIDTTGLSAIDYRMTHIDTDPTCNDAYYSETLYRLPGNLWWCYRPMPDMPEINPLPAITNGYVTFGSTNNFSKVSPEILSIWIDILRALPNSRLIIVGVPEGNTHKALIEKFASNGIGTDRLTLYGRLPLTEFWKLHHQIDIVFDTFPYNGGTTTCDALWLGVPVITLIGQKFASRMGNALLKNIGLPELSANNIHEYLEIAVNLAKNLDYLKILREGMRQRLAGSPLRNEEGFTRNLESAYRDIWLKWCKEGAPKTLPPH